MRSKLKGGGKRLVILSIDRGRIAVVARKLLIPARKSEGKMEQTTKRAKLLLDITGLEGFDINFARRTVNFNNCLYFFVVHLSPVKSLRRYSTLV